jgi:hypothetical protein
MTPQGRAVLVIAIRIAMLVGLVFMVREFPVELAVLSAAILGVSMPEVNRES